MIQRLKVILMRFAIKATVRILWWRKVPQNVTVKTNTIQVSEAQIRLRIYTPMGRGPFPIIVFYHAGGFVIGDLETHDPLCRDLCIKSGRVIVSVDYRLAPENPFPCAPNDCFAALKWVVDNA